MRKRTRISEPFKEEFGWEDYVSALPDPILVSILSRLTLKEAVATSILSRRWRYLWTHVNDLKFDANDTLNNSVYDDKLMTSERSRYINWVNRVLRQHRGPVVDGVRICFNFHESSKRAVDNWVKFAIVKRVQRLELCLRVGYYNYTFPYKLLSRSKGMSLKNICSNYGLIQPGMPSRLEVLKLKSVNVSEEALDHIFSNCPVLNHLSIHNLGNLENVKVSGLTLRLKYLEVVSCCDVKSIEISNVNLVSFAYFGHHIKLIVCNVPMLGEISFGVQYYGYGLEKNVFEQLSCCLHQLEIVTLDIRYPEDNRMISAFPVLPNLKQLILKVGPWDDESLLALTSLIKACPNLNRFVLKYLYTSTLKRRKLSQGAKCMHEHLKSVEFIGYCGRTRDAEAVMYFIENAVALETIVIDPRNQIFARRHARKHLESKIPPGVQLIIL